MSFDRLSIKVDEGQVTVAGDLDMLSSPIMADTVIQFVSTTDSRVDLDLSGVTYIDSSGVHALIRLRASIPSMRVTAVSPRVERLLAMTDTVSLLCGPARLAEAG